MNQRGFATLEVILMVMVIGILASIAVPRFTSVTAAANTAKVQADLTTLDAAISVYYMDNGDYPAGTDISVLENYVNGAKDNDLKPPKGKVYLSGTEQSVSATTYTMQNFTSNSVTVKRAVYGTDNTAEKFHK